MVRLFTVRRHTRKLHSGMGGPVIKVIVVILPNPLTPGLNQFTRFQLSVKEGCENLRRQITRADVDPCVLVRFAAKETAAIGSFFPNDFGAFDMLRIVNQQRAAFAAGKILGLVETLGG